MPSDSKVYIVGVGSSEASSADSSNKKRTKSLVSAAVKALLDAGLTFEYVSQGVTCQSGEPSGTVAGVFEVLGGSDVPIDNVKVGSELESAFQCVGARGSQCVLLIVGEKVRVL